MAVNMDTTNKLVGKVNSIEAHRISIASTGAAVVESTAMLEQLLIMSTAIPKLTLIQGSYSFLISISPIIASQFFGVYYNDSSIERLGTINTKALNVMIMSLMTNVQSLVLALTLNYPSIGVNLKVLKCFDEVYANCIATCRDYKDKSHFSFDNDHLSLEKFSVFLKIKGGNTKAIINDLTLKLESNTIYKLSAKSGSGKTIFLNALIKNWYYVSGEVKLPSAENKMCFIPKDPFIPPKTLLEILIYPLTLKEYLVKYCLKSEHEHKHDLIEDKKSNEEVSLVQKINKEKLIVNIKELLVSFNLWNKQIEVDPEDTRINLNDLEDADINWNQRLSGGERQKIGIIRAMLTKPSFIIMDEATNALDKINKAMVFNKIKEILKLNTNWTLIYTEHDESTDEFADCILNISEQKVYKVEMHDTSTSIVGDIDW